MARRETNLKAPQFGVGGHLKADPVKETPAELIPAVQKESAKDVRDPGTTSANGTPSFWYPRDLDLPATSAPKIAAKVAPKAKEKRKVEVIVRKKRAFSV
ncbi:hypothetical protein H7F10_07225 [Acidithiobacillus sp. HP-6]|uniref:hypothetical protein n=1 Tax=unclassified Acidithiobacillus TaxID=2614800 RepID=UPI0018790B2F|nr:MULTISPECIES: hypothetical protein [unclassified Acidithiobacillus]MBE7562744.1 hypothetical protein [Acidithiobacillus sp. HP-6]MBE7570460.1 hypothetical protein [Acidithiobacillus sp. HP-2]